MEHHETFKVYIEIRGQEKDFKKNYFMGTVEIYIQ